MPANVVFFAGGPGLRASYAMTPLRTLPITSEWAYLDQTGSDKRADATLVTAQKVLEAAMNLVVARAKLGPVTIVAHSWGSWLATALLEQTVPDAIDRVLLLHPAPPTRAGLDETVAALFSRVKPDTLAKIAPLMERLDEAAGIAVMKALLPAYCGREDNLPTLDLRLSPSTYHSVMASLGDYNHRAVVAANKQRLTLVFGLSDYITPELYERHAGSLAGFDVVSVRGGHFGFLEDPEFAAVLELRGF